MDVEENKAVFRRYMKMWVTGDTQELGEVIGPGYVGHSGSDPDRDDDAESLKEHIAGYHAAYPEVDVVIEDQVAEGDLVFTRMTARSPDHDSGGEKVAAGFNASRFSEGKIVEEWALWERP